MPENTVRNIDEEIEYLVKTAGDDLNSWDDLPPISEDQEYRKATN